MGEQKMHSFVSMFEPDAMWRVVLNHNFTLQNTLPLFSDVLDLSEAIDSDSGPLYISTADRLIIVGSKSRVGLIIPRAELQLPEFITESNIEQVVYSTTSFVNQPQPGTYILFSEFDEMLAFAIYQTKLTVSPFVSGDRVTVKQGWEFGSSTAADIQALILAMQAGMKPVGNENEAALSTINVQRVDEHGRYYVDSRTDIMWLDPDDEDDDE